VNERQQTALSGMSDCLSDELNRRFGGRPAQSIAAAWRVNRPRVAAGLSAQATTRLGAPSSRQRPPAGTQPRSIFASPRPFFLAAAAAKLSQLRRRHNRAQLAPSHSSTTAIAPPSPQHPIASPRAADSTW